LLSEIEFLTHYARDNDNVVYAGAAPGTHLLFLVTLFPTINFILFDPEPFATCLNNHHQITVIPDIFTDECARCFNQKDVLFISDIRTAEPRAMSDHEVETRVRADNKMQMRWVQLIQPRVSMLKFRLPWDTCNELKRWRFCNHLSSLPFVLSESSVYLDGKVYLPVWGPQTTTETRLVVEDWRKTRIWNHKYYEGRV
jgi:hypothetical protein